MTHTETTETRTTETRTTETPATKTPVTVLGLGPMGRALAAAFVEAGHPTTVWNRTSGKAAELAEKGAHVAAGVAEAAAASPLVVVCVLDHEAVRAITGPAAEALRGRTLLNLTSTAAGHARETAAWAAEHGIGHLDGAIMTPTTTIGGPDAVYLYSGPQELHERHAEALAALGGTGTYLGADPGLAGAYDASLLDFFWTSVSGYVHALALARAEGVKPTDLAPFARNIGTLMASVTHALAEEVEHGRYAGDDSNIRSVHAAMTHILHAADAHGLDSGVMRAAKALADRAVADGHGEAAISRLTETVARPSS
ncbi:NAD(P)-binding domain-containing protein [Streptomyces albiaxialis]|uniref:NAD(P)-binding domain-containing protein n=1 Tax=Streptomyces albiaxialis TaxID=329523 RepID=A0ABP5HIB0_9ACTN